MTRTSFRGLLALGTGVAALATSPAIGNAKTAVELCRICGPECPSLQEEFCATLCGIQVQNFQCSNDQWCGDEVSIYCEGKPME